MLTDPSPYFAALLLFAFATYIGLIPVHRLIQRTEARHELRVGSASYLRRTGGVTLMVMWLIALGFCASIIGDWAATGDLEPALDRAGRRIALLLRFAGSFF